MVMHFQKYGQMIKKFVRDGLQQLHDQRVHRQQATDTLNQNEQQNTNHSDRPLRPKRSFSSFNENGFNDSFHGAPKRKRRRIDKFCVICFILFMSCTNDKKKTCPIQERYQESRNKRFFQ